MNKKLNMNLTDLPRIAKQNNWKFRYDFELDNLYYVPADIPKDARLYNLNNEFAIYLTQKNAVSGIFIEYWRTNFLNHKKKAYKRMLDLFNKRSGNLKKTAEEEGEAEVYEKAIITEVLQGISELKQPAL